jgi:hypothetical protein
MTSARDQLKMKSKPDQGPAPAPSSSSQLQLQLLGQELLTEEGLAKDPGRVWPRYRVRSRFYMKTQ